MESRMPPGCFSWDSGETLARNSPPTVSSGERHGRARRRGGIDGIGARGVAGGGREAWMSRRGDWWWGMPANWVVASERGEQFDRRKRGFAVLSF